MPEKYFLEIANCPKCMTPLQVGSYLKQFCPSCQWTSDGAPAPEKVLCCSKCKHPLTVTSPRWSVYCLSCIFTPARTDITLEPRKAAA